MAQQQPFFKTLGLYQSHRVDAKCFVRIVYFSERSIVLPGIDKKQKHLECKFPFAANASLYSLPEKDESQSLLPATPCSLSRHVTSRWEKPTYIYIYTPKIINY